MKKFHCFQVAFRQISQDIETIKNQTVSKIEKSRNNDDKN